MDNSLIDSLPFSTLNDLQLIGEYCATKNDRLPMSAYENLTFNYDHTVATA